MNSAVISSKDMGSKCWSALRFVNECHRCTKVLTCKTENAPLARLKVAQQLSNEKERIEKILEERAKEMAG